jgi:hypothetical protein
MTKRKELRQLYGGRVPDSYLPAHNHISHIPETHHGERGFRRFWIPPQWAGKGWSRCPCGWGVLPNPPREPRCLPITHSWYKRDKDVPHYASSEHVKRWKERIKKHGSLEAAQRQVAKELRAYYGEYGLNVYDEH